MEHSSIPKPNNISEIWWKEVLKKVADSAVFLDRFCCESLHFNGGVSQLLESRCLAIKEFSPFEASTSISKAVFFISSPLYGWSLKTLRDIIISSDFSSVTVITGCHQSVLTFISHGDDTESVREEPYRKIEKDIANWMNKGSSAEVFYFPLILVPLLSDTFLLPLFSDIYSVNGFGGKEQKAESFMVPALTDKEFHHLPWDLQVSIQHFVVCIHSFLQGMCAWEEIYSMGRLATVVADRLETFSPARQRRKNATHKISLVLLDRDLDLVSPTSCGSSVFMERILSILQRLPGHSVDSEVDLSPISSVHPSCSRQVLVPGSFVHGSTDAEEVFDLTFMESSKKVVHTINKKVEDSLSRRGEKNTHDADGQSAREDILLQNIKRLWSCKDQNEENFDLIQLGLGVVQTMKHERNETLDRLHGLQKHWLQCAQGNSDELTPVQEVLQLLRTRESKNIGLVDILVLLLHSTSLVGSKAFDGISRDFFVDVFSQAVLEEQKKGDPEFENLVGKEINKIEAKEFASFVWSRLVDLSRTRSRLKNYGCLWSRESEMEPYLYDSVVSQVVRDIVSPPDSPPSDLEIRSTGLKDFIKTGFSLFVNITKPRPKDAAVVIIYIIGGVTPSELKEMRREVKRANLKCEVVFGSSHLATPQNSVHQIFRKKEAVKHC